jgi:hypothetical protein
MRFVQKLPLEDKMHSMQGMASKSWVQVLALTLNDSVGLDKSLRTLVTIRNVNPSEQVKPQEVEDQVLISTHSLDWPPPMFSEQSTAPYTVAAT